MLRFVLCICVFMYPTQVCVFPLLRFARWARRLFMCTSSFTARSFFQLGHRVAVLYPHSSESNPRICFINGKYTHNLTFSDTSWPSVLFCPCPRVLCHHGSGNFDCFVLVFKLLSSGNVSDMPGDSQIWKHDNATFEQQTVIYYPNVNPWYLRSTLHWK